MDARRQKLAGLKERINKSQQQNLRESLEEKKLLKDPLYAKGRQKAAAKDHDAEKPDDEDSKRDPQLDEPAQAALNRKRKREWKEENVHFGWNYFNNDALYRAHNKRLNETVFWEGEYAKQEEEMGEKVFTAPRHAIVPSHKPTDKAKERLASMVEKQLAQRAKFKRRRSEYVDEETIDYINDRNRHFNKKLERHFDTYSLQYKQNLERGTNV